MHTALEATAVVHSASRLVTTLFLEVVEVAAQSSLFMEQMLLQQVEEAGAVQTDTAIRTIRMRGLAEETLQDAYQAAPPSLVVLVPRAYLAQVVCNTKELAVPAEAAVAATLEEAQVQTVLQAHIIREVEVVGGNLNLNIFIAHPFLTLSKNTKHLTVVT